MADPVYANEILISPSNPVIELGKSVQLNALVLPENATNKNVSWSTTIGSYANVSIDKNGLATGILVGRGFVRASVSSVSSTVDVDVVNPEGAVLVKKITISQNSLNLKKGDKIKLTATVSPSNATCKNIIWRTPQGAVTTVDQDGNVVAISVGSSRIIAVSADNNAEAWISVKVTESDQPAPVPDEEPKYAVHLNPRNVEVRKGQLFMVRVRAMNVEAISKSRVYKDNFQWLQYLGGGWKFTPGSSSITFVKSEFINTHEAAAWFRAGNTPGDYTITVSNDNYDGLDPVTCSVRIINEYHGGDVDTLLPDYYNIEFQSNDVVSSNNYNNNPCGFKVYTKKESDSSGKDVSNPGDVVGWRIPSTGVVGNITSDSKKFYINRGDEYGIVAAQLYLKSEPYIYFPVWIEYNGGSYKKYLTCGNESTTNSVVSSVTLSNSSIVVARNSTKQVTASVVFSKGSDNNGVKCVANDSSIAELYGNVTAQGTKYLLTIKGKQVGTTTFTVSSVTDPSKSATLTVTVVESDGDVYTPVSRIAVSPSSVRYSTNGKFTLNGQAVLDNAGIIQYSNDVVFESSDESVASIVSVDKSSASVAKAIISTGSVNGTAVITVSSSRNPSIYGTCTVIVDEAAHGEDGEILNPVDSVTMSESEIEIAVGDYHQLYASVVGKFSAVVTNPKVLWGSSNDTVVGVNATGRIFGLAVGTSVVTAVSDDDNTKFASCIVTVRERTEDDGPIVIPEDERSDYSSDGIDTIVRIDYNEDGTFDYTKLFDGNLGLDADHPIESVVYHETEKIQKIYWVDGQNVLRFMNFMEEKDSRGLYPWQNDQGDYDSTYFDSNRSVNFGVDVTVTKDNSGNTRPNGVIQYLLTYYNKHGQESGYVWISDLVYLSPVASGGAADGTNNNAVSLTINNLDTRFSHFRIYSVFRSALNGTTVSYIVFEGKTTSEKVTVVDNNSHLTAVDSSRLLYLGSQHVIADTLTHKDQTLFLGGLGSVDRKYDEVEKTLKSTMIQYGWECNCIEFVRSADIPNETSDGSYSYSNQLVYSSSKITSFKGGEKYRFALVFHKKDGTLTDAFWIGDKVNKLYPIIGDNAIERIIAVCTLPPAVVQMMKDKGYRTAQLMIAEATYADRSVKAQGIVSPTVFNVWNRFKNRLYSEASWLMRPRNSEYAWRHFDVIHRSTLSTGEIQCNYWSVEEQTPTPYYGIESYDQASRKYTEEFDGIDPDDAMMIIYRVKREMYIAQANHYGLGATVIFIKSSDQQKSLTYEFGGSIMKSIVSIIQSNSEQEHILTDGDVIIKVCNFPIYISNTVGQQTPHSIEEAHTHTISSIRKKYPFLDNERTVDLATFNTWCDRLPSYATHTGAFYFNYYNGEMYQTATTAVNDNGNCGIDRWWISNEDGIGNSIDYIPSYYKKHLMFVDENVVTLNSPEIEYEAISFDKVDGYKFRIVGVAKIDSNYSDYTVEATPGKFSGENLVHDELSDHLIAWPLWKEKSLKEREAGDEGDKDYEGPEEDKSVRDSSDYVWGGSNVKYWLYMWQHAGKISTFTNVIGVDDLNDDYSRLISKTFANSRYSSKTVYNDIQDVYDPETHMRWDCVPDSIRIFNFTSSQYVGINIGSDVRYYDGIVNDSLSVPGTHKYPILFSAGITDTSGGLSVTEDSCYLYSSDPVSISYASTPHAVISLPSRNVDFGGIEMYEQTILPRMIGDDQLEFRTGNDHYTGALLPWIENRTDNSLYPFRDYTVYQEEYNVPGYNPDEANKYLFIGEIYSDLSDGDDIRYGGTSDAAIQNCRFVIAGPQYRVDEMIGNGDDTMIANQGDTYIQRWDCLKTKPYSTGALNNVIDITSVMLETHINIDGRTDLQRGTNYIASIDTEKFGQINPVYSQNNNFITQRDLDEDFNLDAYRSSITWSLEKHDSEEIDEWSHVTLASTLKLDGDKGDCQALRRLGNSIIAFQDRGISEILFNSRTQLTTQDGVPVEIANSGKVDGKRYITNKYGCTNKWSIVEGKNALYFVDSINKAFCGFNGQSIENLSTKLGFGNWFRDVNDRKSWKPSKFNNIISHYDKVHSDIYLVRKSNDEMPCLVYSETLGAFTSFFDYNAVPMMVNVEDRFVSFRDNKMWLQNEGLYCNFFGKKHDYWVQYRVTPDPYLDKIWTNIDYRADFYEVLNSDGVSNVPEEYLINGDAYGELSDTYKEWETFTDYKVWNEYQTTGFTDFTHDYFDRDDVRKKFRIWRLAIPRALREGTNRHGMDRIRNPWINLLFRKSDVDGRYLMQLHDIVVKYFE